MQVVEVTASQPRADRRSQEAAASNRQSAGGSTSLPIALASAAPGNAGCVGTPVSAASCPAVGTHQSSACTPALSCHQQQAPSSAPCVARACADMHAAKGSSTASQTGPSAGGSENQSPVVGTVWQPRPAKRRPPASFAAQQDARPQAAAVGAHARPGRRKLPASLAASASGGSSSSVLKPLQLPQGSVVYASTSEEVEEVCSALLRSGVPALGFDIEWRVTYKTGETPRPVALVQLAAQQGAGTPRCYLLHVSAAGITPALRAILCSPAVAKAGVGCAGDAQKLMRDFGLPVAGCVDLSEQANLRMCGPGSQRTPETWSLCRLAAAVLHAGIDKAQELRTSNWEAWPLSLDQQQYAALDVLASLLLYQRIMAMPLPELPPALPAPEEAAGPEACAAQQQPLHVPAAPNQAPLQPAKLAAWRLFMEQGLSPAAIAEVRHISRDSAEGYLSEAITAGFAYDWHRMGVPQAVLEAVGRQAAAAWGAATAEKTTCSCACIADGGAVGPVGPGREQSEATGDAAAGQADADSATCADGAAGAPMVRTEIGRRVPLLACAAGEDLTVKLQAAGVSVKTLKEALPESVRYGQVRLSIAHIGRLGLLQPLPSHDGVEMST